MLLCCVGGCVVVVVGVVQSPQVKDLIERMLHPDPLQRATLSRVRKHPWAAPVVAAVYKSISEPKDCSLLISDDPTKDLYEGALRKVCSRVRVCARPGLGVFAVSAARLV